MKERLLKEIQKGSKSATMKKHVITYLIYNENATITDLSKSMNLSIPTVTKVIDEMHEEGYIDCLLYTSPSPRDVEESRMPSSA